MKSREISFVKSFQFKIIMYSLFSLLLAGLTEGIGILALYQLGVFSHYLSLTKTRNFTINPNANLNGNAPMIANEFGRSNFYNNNLNENSFDAEGLAMDRLVGPKNSSLWGFGIDVPDLIVFIIIAFLVGVILFVGYFLLFSRRIPVSLAKIATGIESVSIGDMNTRVEIDGEDEFALIGEKLNKMVTDISILMENERKNEALKNNLITNVAHDLRTPLTSVIGYLELIIKNRNLEENVKEKYVEIAYDKSLRLQKLIEDLFSYTKVSQGEVQPKLEPLNVVALMEQMINEFYPLFQESQLEYEFVTKQNCILVMADGDMLARAFSNLLGNAVKYGKDGKNIRVYIHTNVNEQTVSILVINYGKVIPEKDLEYIFDRFYRVESSRSEITGGSGLGLAIAKRIIAMHDGTIEASSSLEGTIFEVKLKIITQNN